VSQNRTALRRQFRNLRNSISQEERKSNSSTIISKLLRSSRIISSTRIGLYWPSDGEVDLIPIIKILNNYGIKTALPVVIDKHKMIFVYYAYGQDLVSNQFGISEPKDKGNLCEFNTKDTLLIPLVAFDGHNGRLGMGGGFYDRYLSNIGIPDKPLLVGIAHQIQFSPSALPLRKWDQKMDTIVTEKTTTPK